MQVIKTEIDTQLKGIYGELLEKAIGNVIARVRERLGKIEPINGSGADGHSFPMTQIEESFAKIKIAQIEMATDVAQTKMNQRTLQLEVRK